MLRRVATAGYLPARATMSTMCRRFPLSSNHNNTGLLLLRHHPWSLSLVRGFGSSSGGGGAPTVSDRAHSPHPSPPLRGSVDLNKHSFIDEAKNLKESETWSHPSEHGVWDLNDVAAVKPTHRVPLGLVDRAADTAVKIIRFWFDLVSGYKWGKLTESKCLTRIVFLETIAGVPGMVAGMLRHTRSLRLMRRDHGWIHTLLEEAENERMHLLTFLEMRKPGLPLRALVFVSQGIFFNTFFVMYLISPRFCHRLVGYIEEEAVRTYTHIIEEIDHGHLFAGRAAPPIAVSYWRLPKTATVRDLMVAVRADEAGHKLVNHTFADMHANGMQDSVNPFIARRSDDHHPPATAESVRLEQLQQQQQSSGPHK